MPDFFFL